MVPILTYHSVGRLNPILDTPIEKFESHLKAFAEKGYTSVTLSDLVALISSRKTLPAKTLVLTFDDGYKAFHSEAWPLLKKYGFTATVFLISDYCGKDNRWIGQPDSVPTAPLLTWDEVALLSKEGCEFGGHTSNHLPLSTISGERLTRELVQSKERIQEATNKDVTTFAYPYGDTTGDAVREVQKHYQGAVSTDLGISSSESNPYLLPRIDSYYLTQEWIDNLEKPWFRPYLGFRQMLRRAKRMVQPDWQPDEYRNLSMN
ncbi:MAG TPA: polysaccharide deacetylase family protein [Drouetiella sp.]